MKKYRAISLALALGLTLTTAPALAKTPKPTLAEIEAAKKVEAAKKKSTAIKVFETRSIAVKLSPLI